MYSYSSDCFKHAPDVLYDKLATVIRSFLIHGHVTLFLLIATLLPIIKDKLGSISTSKNYRSIAISSTILKIIDWVILLLFGTSLGLDEFRASSRNLEQGRLKKLGNLSLKIIGESLTPLLINLYCVFKLKFFQFQREPDYPF